MQIYNADCLEKLKELAPETIDMVLLDLPYGQTNHPWDIKIDLTKLWEELRRVCKPEASVLMYTTVRYGIDLIKSNPTGFKYDLVWYKSRMVGFLNANKMPMRNHEMIYVFSLGTTRDDVKIERNLELRAYAATVDAYIGKSRKELKESLGNYGMSKFLEYKTRQFSIPRAETYDKVTRDHKLQDMKGYKTYDQMKALQEYPPGARPRTYNYGHGRLLSVLRYDNPKDHIHPTQKPVDLNVALIKAYTNPHDTVLDATMGSGSTGIACLETGRKFVGIEKDPKIFLQARHRLLKYDLLKKLESHSIDGPKTSKPFLYDGPESCTRRPRKEICGGTTQAVLI